MTKLLTFAAMLVLSFSAYAEEKKSEEVISAVKIGDSATAGWDATTLESATTDDQKKVLKKGKVETVTGEVVDLSCYQQLGKVGKAHEDCGKKCILNGQPIGMLEKGKKLVLIVPEEHHPRRDGGVSLRETFAEQMGKTVTVTGMMTKQDGVRTLFVKAAPLTPKKAK